MNVLNATELCTLCLWIISQFKKKREKKYLKNCKRKEDVGPFCPSFPLSDLSQMPGDAGSSSSKEEPVLFRGTSWNGTEHSRGPMSGV